MGSYTVLLTIVPSVKVVVTGLRLVPVRVNTLSLDVRVGWLTGTAATMAMLLSRDRIVVETFMVAVLLCEVAFLPFVLSLLDRSCRRSFGEGRACGLATILLYCIVESFLL